MERVTMKKIVVTNADIFVTLVFLSAFGGLIATKYDYHKLGVCGFIGVFVFLLIGLLMTVVPKKDCMLKCALCGHERLKSAYIIKNDYLWFGEWLCPVCFNGNPVRSTRLRGFKPAKGAARDKSAMK